MASSGEPSAAEGRGSVAPEPPSADGVAPAAGEAPAASVAVRRPVALMYGPAHVVVHGNPPFLLVFGSAPVGIPAVEGLVDLPPEAFDLFDAVFASGRPLVLPVVVLGVPCRLTAVPRSIQATGEVYGVAFRLAPA